MLLVVAAVMVEARMPTHRVLEAFDTDWCAVDVGRGGPASPINVHGAERAAALTTRTSVANDAAFA